MEQSNISIAIDGPAAAGKSTVARKIAKKLGYVYIDTGAMYRALTYAALEQKLDLEDEQAIYKLLLETPIELKQAAQGQRVFINDQDITEAIRQQHVSNHVSYVAKHPLVRREMVNRQQEMSRDLGVVMDGRDIGTHVLPEAEVKIFLIATVAERAKRRYEENQGKGMEVDLETLKKEIEQRDYIDSNREASPLVKAADAVEIDTTALDIDSVAEAILDEVYKVIG